MADFNAALEALEGEGATVVAASTDPLESARKVIQEHALRFPVGYGLDLHRTAQALTAFYEERRGILHATGFALHPDGSIAVACYSTAQIGRLVPADVQRALSFWRKRSASR